MNLLAKEYFSLQEISNIWAVSRDDLLYYGENNILESSVRPAAIAAGIERVCYNTEFANGIINYVELMEMASNATVNNTSSGI